MVECLGVEAGRAYGAEGRGFEPIYCGVDRKSFDPAWVKTLSVDSAVNGFFFRIMEG